MVLTVTRVDYLEALGTEGLYLEEIRKHSQREEWGETAEEVENPTCYNTTVCKKI